MGPMNHTTARKNRGFLHLTSLAVLGGAALAAACSSPTFQKPEATGGSGDGSGGAAADGGKEATGGRAASGTGGTAVRDDAGVETDGGLDTDAGTGGASGSGGASGAEDGGSNVECTRDSDCVALTCNGEPHCNEDGKCDPGLPCENPDPAHCSVSCVRSGGHASCQPEGLDADGDGHLDAVCASGGGDDCDDKTPTTYAGAAEQCDGKDNDCDGKVDLEDGLLLGGEPKLVHEVDGTASLGIVASPKGYGLFEIARVSAKVVPAKAANAIFIDYQGNRTVVPLAGDFRDEPSIGYISEQFVIYENNDPNAPNFLRFPFGGGALSKEPLKKMLMSGRAFSVPTNVGFASFPSGVYTTKPNTGEASSLCDTSLAPGDDWSCHAIVKVDPPKLLFAPAKAEGAYAWVEASGALNADHTLVLQFSTVDAQHKLRPATPLQSINVAVDGTYYTALHYETIRPQVVTTPIDAVVGWNSDAGLHLARYADGKETCRAQPVSGLSWGWANSLIPLHSLSAARPEVHVVAVGSDRAPVILTLDAKCRVSPATPLSMDGAKVALGTTTGRKGEPFLEVGHPVIATFQGANIGTAWVEEPKANGLHRVMFRSFGDKLCN
jgi:hypothetical protein